MKTYTVYFNNPVTLKYKGDRFNKELKKWEYDVDCEKTSDTFTFYSLAPAKKLIKENIKEYKDSCITKTWSNGDWENLGPIKLTGSNKIFIANTRQKVANY